MNKINIHSLVSIVIPAYNAEKYIEKCINSILQQTYSNLEILVIDDASTDRTAEIVKSIKDDRIIYIRNEKNLGWRLNVSKGYELCGGEFVTICPVDDYLINTFVEEAVEVFSYYPNVGIWSCGNITIDEKENILGTNIRPIIGLINSKEYFRFTFSMQNISAPPETMIRNVCLEKVNAVECYKGIYKQFPEINLYLRIANLCYDSFHTSENLCYRTSRKDSITGKYGAQPLIMVDYYNIFHSYFKYPQINDEIVYSTNQYLFIKCIRLIKSYLKNRQFNLIPSIITILIKNDFIINTKNYYQKLVRILEFFFLIPIHLFKVKY